MTCSILTVSPTPEYSFIWTHLGVALIFCDKSTIIDNFLIAEKVESYTDAKAN